MTESEDAPLLRERHFTEARSALQARPSPQAWERLCEAVRAGAYPAPGYPAEVARSFRERYLPYIEEGLSRWPDELRVVDAQSPEHVMRLGRIFDFQSPRGKPPRREVDALVTAMRTDTFTGFRLETLRHDALHLMQRFCTRLDPREGLTHLYLALEPHECFNTVGDIVPPNALDRAALEELMRWIFTTSHTTLEVLALHVSSRADSASVDAIWGTLLTWAPRLERLRELHIGRARSDSRDWGAAILDDPSFDRLTSLAEYDHRADRIDRALLMRRDASKNLNRLKMFALANDATEELLDHPNLANVTTWDIRPGTEDTSLAGWGSAHAEHWAHVLAKRRGEPVSEVHPLLRQQELVIEKMGYRELHAIFLDDAQRLAHSEWLEELELGALTPNLLHALTSQGHEAFPNLKSLRFADHVHLSPADYERIGRAELARQLTTLSLTREMFSAYLPVHQREGMFDIVAPQWLMLARDETLDLRVRRDAWETFLFSELNTLPFQRKRASMLELQGASSLNSQQLARRIEEAIPEALRADH